MRKLVKKSEGKFNTVEAFCGCACSCSCGCGKWSTKNSKKNSVKNLGNISGQLSR